MLPNLSQRVPVSWTSPHPTRARFTSSSETKSAQNVGNTMEDDGTF